MRISTSDLTLESAAKVLADVSAISRDDVLATRWGESVSVVLDELRTQPSRAASARTLEVDGSPVAFGGVYVLHEGVGLVWFVGSRRVESFPVSVHKSARVALTSLHESGLFHRLFTYCLESSTPSLRWLHRLGFVREGVMLRYGRRAEDFSVWRFDP